jgi:hypothetical protein
MNIAITKTTGVEYPPVFQKILEDVAGGVTFDVDDLPTAIEFLEEGVCLQRTDQQMGCIMFAKH